MTVKAGLDWAGGQAAAEVLDVVPRYNPRCRHWLTRCPVLREASPGTW